MDDELNICSIGGCTKPVYVKLRGWCKTHYERWQHRKGDPAVRLKMYHKHGMTNTPEWLAWCTMKQRCMRPSHPKYHHYGGRGITVYQPWVDSFVDFYEHIGARPSKLYSLDRIDNDGNYEPGNVRWATRKEQNLNRRKRQNLTAKER